MKAQPAATSPPDVRTAILLILIWLVACVIAVFLARLPADSAIVDGMYIPQGNDSFYHARRILDALGARGFYQFDDRLHAPDGAWVPWPWAYDYLMARAAALALYFKPGLNPLAFLFEVPVAWILVNAALFLGAVSALRLSLSMRLLAMLAFAFSPLTQLLHATGMLDHHYVELTFALLTIWLGLEWLHRPSDRRWAAALGAALGVAPGFHNGLFILQLMPLSCVFVLWLRNEAPPFRAVLWLAASLLAGTLLVLFPSQPFRQGMFEFSLLSWFHLYVAAGTSACLVYMAWRRPASRANIAGVAVLGAALCVPLATQLLSGLSFVSGRASIIRDVVEAQSVYTLFTATFGPLETASYYSWLLLLVPLFLALHVYRLFRERSPPRIYYSIVVVFGLTLLLAQFRFYYFGFFALVTAGIVLVEQLAERRRWHRGAVATATAVVLLLAYQPSLRDRLFKVAAPGADSGYASAIPLFTELGKLCAEEPGIVLADNNDGNPILFHTDCQVISNNFLLTNADAEQLDRTERLMRLTPEQLRTAAPEIRYLLVRASDFSETRNGVSKLAMDVPIAAKLFAASQPPPGFTLVKAVHKTAESRGPEGIYALLYKISQPHGSSN